jgi:predicted HicB family RNase H-like nuclease
MSVDLHIRLPEDLRDSLAEQAARLGVSLNTLVILALRRWKEDIR